MAVTERKQTEGRKPVARGNEVPRICTAVLSFEDEGCVQFLLVSHRSAHEGPLLGIFPDHFFTMTAA